MTKELVKVVFIMGSSYSGSTMLGLVLGSDDTAFFSGEVKQYMRRRDLKQRQSPGHHFCTCGERYEACPFWKSVHSSYGSQRNLNPVPGFSWSNLRLVTRVVIPVKRGDDDPIPEHARLLEAVHDVAQAENLRGLSEEFEGIRYRPDRKRLNALERLFAALLLSPLNRLFGITSAVAPEPTDAARG